MNRASYDRLRAGTRAVIDRHKGVELAQSFGRAFDTERARVVAPIEDRSHPVHRRARGADAERWQHGLRPRRRRLAQVPTSATARLAAALEEELRAIHAGQ